ncbi:MAG: tetratricopeptide repeat protein [Candidatus Zixiibacteriota bacterium]|nr:MAG: tetratricopeptide repeat protein [candidate division Zixibacteria bacterium]
MTESNGDNRPFIGGQNEGARRKDDDLGIETTTDLMEQETHRNSDSGDSLIDTAEFGSQPIGDSSPPPPPTADYEQPEAAATASENESQPADTKAEDTTGQVKKLSEEDVKKIEQNLYGSTSYLKDQDKAELSRKLNALDASTAQGSPASKSRRADNSSLPGGAKTAARRGSSIAYFYRNFIQLTGQYILMANDVITINERSYTLRPKKIKTPYMVGGFALVLTVVLIILGSFLSPATSSSEGHLVGVVLDDNDRPYIQGALVHIAETDKRIESDQRGFFSAGFVPVGTYTLEYVMDGHVVGVEQASVTDDEVRMVFLRPQDPEDLAQAPAKKQTRSAKVTKAEPSVQGTPAPKTTSTQTSNKASSTSTSKTSAQKTSKDRYGKVALKANVPNARFELDGSILGAGNVTYSKIRTGQHRYRVSADGYQPAEGRLSVESGGTHKLSVTLKPLAQAQKAQSYKPDDYYHAGRNALQQGDYQAAVSDLTEAISAKPSYAEAYYYRGKAYSKLKMHDKAYDDYIRSAEIYQMRKNYGEAIACYNAAVEVDDRVVTAYLGRGNLYLKKGEELAAIADFDRATQIDKRNFQAYYGLGEARFKQQQYKKAIDHFKDARSINDKDPLVYQYLMLSYMALAKYKDVEKTFKKFADVATEEQMNRFKNDQKYSAVLRVIESQ